MKIEIEFEEVQSLKEQVRSQSLKVQSLEEQLKSLNENQIKEDAVKLSKRMFNDYMIATFRHLGFEDIGTDAVIFKDDLAHFLGKSWWNSDRLNVELCAKITTQMRIAFLNLGIKTKEETEDGRI